MRLTCDICTEVYKSINYILVMRVANGLTAKSIIKSVVKDANMSF